MKKTLFLSLCGIMMCVQGFGQQLNVKLKDNTRQSYAINTVRKLTFTNGNVNVHTTDGNSAVFALNGVRYLNFGAETGVKTTPQNRAETVKLYPNPVKETLNIEFSADAAKPVKFEIFSLDGKLIYTRTLGALSQGTSASLSLAHLAQGMYLLVINDGGNPIVKKIIKK